MVAKLMVINHHRNKDIAPKPKAGRLVTPCNPLLDKG